MLTHYKGWSAKERIASGKQTQKAVDEGIIPPPTKCNRCGQTEGVIVYHNEDYSDPINDLEPLCYRCHQWVHTGHRYPEAAARYWKEIENGKCFPPVFWGRPKEK